MSAVALTLADAARIVREAAKDKTYQEATPLGPEVAQYLRYFKNQRDATPDSLRDYESPLAKLCLDYADLELRDFEPPVGTERVEEFLYRHWETKANGEPTDPRTFSKQVSILVSFFDWAVKKRKMYGNPARAIDRPRKRKKRVALFAPSMRQKVIDAQDYIADDLGCELILLDALRRGELARAQLKHFDVERRRLHVFGKGRKERSVPIPREAFWTKLVRFQIEVGAGPDTYLLYRMDTRRRKVPLDQATEVLQLKGGPVGYAWVTEYKHDREIAGHSVHRWWYRCLERAGVVTEGITSGENMHRGRHTAITEFLRSPKGDLKLAQLLAGHSDIRTTADTYDHRDVEDLARALAVFFEED